MADEQIFISIEGFRKLLRKLDASKKDSVIKFSLFQGAQHLAAWSKQKRLSGARPRILGVVSGRLRSSISASRTEHTGDQYIARIGTNVKYGKVHELGFKGTVGVKSFIRRGKDGTHLVRSHTRNMNMPKRPFLKPAIEDRGNRTEVLKILMENINGAIARA